MTQSPMFQYTILWVVVSGDAHFFRGIVFYGDSKPDDSGCPELLSVDVEPESDSLLVADSSAGIESVLGDEIGFPLPFFFTSPRYVLNFPRSSSHSISVNPPCSRSGI